MFYESLLNLENGDHVCPVFSFYGDQYRALVSGCCDNRGFVTTGSSDFVAGCLVGCCLLVNARLSLEISREWFVGSEKAERSSERGYCNL